MTSMPRYKVTVDFTDAAKALRSMTFHGNIAAFCFHFL